jgi:hypothetical protein
MITMWLLLNVVRIVSRIKDFQDIQNGNILSSLINVTICINPVKRKIERFVPNTIVIKNPIPDELIKPLDLKLDKNVYL